MSKIKSQLGKVGMLAAGLAFASSASAGFLNVEIDTPNPAEAVYVTVTPVGNSPVTAQNDVYVYAGIYNETINGSAVETPGFCIDVAHDVSIGEVFNNYSYASLVNAADPPAGPMTGGQAIAIEKLWAAYYAGAKVSAMDAAALQVAIWETLGNGQPLGNGNAGYTVTEGSSGAPNNTTGEVFALAQTYINSLSTLTTEAGLEAIVSPTGQAYVIVPEPTTMIAGAMLLIPFGLSTLRFVRKNRWA